MKKLLLIVLMCSGCSGVFANRQSPVKVEGCYLWAPIIDTIVATAVIGAASSMYESKIIKEPDNTIAFGTTMMYSTAFVISAITGYAEYAHCRSELSSLKEENVQNLSQK